MRELNDMGRAYRYATHRLFSSRHALPRDVDINFFRAVHALEKSLVEPIVKPCSYCTAQAFEPNPSFSMPSIPNNRSLSVYSNVRIRNIERNLQLLRELESSRSDDGHALEAEVDRGTSEGRPGRPLHAHWQPDVQPKVCLCAAHYAAVGGV